MLQAASPTLVQSLWKQRMKQRTKVVSSAADKISRVARIASTLESAALLSELEKQKEFMGD